MCAWLVPVFTPFPGIRRALLSPVSQSVSALDTGWIWNAGWSWSITREHPPPPPPDPVDSIYRTLRAALTKQNPAREPTLVIHTSLRASCALQIVDNGRTGAGLRNSLGSEEAPRSGDVHFR